MTILSLPLNQLIHEDLSLVVSFCFARGPLLRLFAERFKGEWKYLQKALFETSELRANRAVLELAMLLRLLDDRDDLSGSLQKTGGGSFGRLIIAEKPNQDLGMRDVANKIIHASRLEWDLSKPDNPVLVCVSHENEKWLRAEVDVVALAGFCGRLMS